MVSRGPAAPHTLRQVWHPAPLLLIRAGGGPMRKTPPHHVCPKCGAAMRAATITDPNLQQSTQVWRCIRCGEEVAQ